MDFTLFFLRNQFTIRTNEMAVTSGNQTLNTVFFLYNMWVSIRAETDCWRFNPSRNQTVLGKHLLRRLLKGYLDLPEFGCVYVYIYSICFANIKQTHDNRGSEFQFYKSCTSRKKLRDIHWLSGHWVIAKIIKEYLDCFIDPIRLVARHCITNIGGW